jgi:competence protein ComEC
MCFYILAFFVGTVFLQFFKILPNLFIVIVLLIFLALGAFFIKYLRIIFVFGLGLFWSLLYVHAITSCSLPDNLVGKNITITGYIASLPQQDELHEKFLFNTGKTMLQISWYGRYPRLKSGDKWRLLVKLKKPHETMNPGGFDYEKYLFQHKVRAVGYVRPSNLNIRLSSNWYKYPINRVRQHLAKKINYALYKSPLKGLIIALVIGNRNGITSAQWNVFRNTGTSHLVAISGLHIGLVSGFIFLFLNFIWRRISYLTLRLPASKAAAIGALLSALIYSAMAGFSLPTQRALTMITVFMLVLFLNRNIKAWYSFFVALLIVLIINPLSSLSAGFWLSFGAVAMLIYCFSGRLKPGGLWWKWGRAQLVVVLGLMPLCLLLFQQFSLVALFANIIAIPVMSFLVVPLSLLGCMLSKWLLIGAEKILELLWRYLQWLATGHWSVWHHSIINYWILATALIGIILLSAPRGFPRRWLGIIWLFPLFFYRPACPKAGEVWFTLLDVGQGLASIVRTQHHVLIYDTGPKYSASFDTGKAIVVPFLRTFGINNVSMLVISHGDNDHIGRTGQIWQWDGVYFQFLSPEQNSGLQGNDASCVLKITDGKNSILLTGDIEALTEHILVGARLPRPNNNLKSSILIAPHHGSNSSSTWAFVNATRPNYVLFPVGYLNRYGFPSKKVIARYQAIHAKFFNSVDSGAITFKFNGQNAITSPSEYRKLTGRYWNNS